MKKLILTALFFCGTMIAFAQSIDPKVTFLNKETNEIDTISPGDVVSAEAPLDISCHANVYCPSNYSYKLEWRIFAENQGEEKPEVTRFVDNIDYTLTSDGSFCMKLYATFWDASGQELEIESDKFKITIASSKLSCPDGFSPNGDGINDILKITCQSIVKVDGIIFNRWGQRLHTFTVENLADGWDGMVGGKPVKDGVYFININAYGADGIHYKIKKAINVLKGYREDTEGGMEN